ncbi:SDR family oxidoreductase [Chryseobacterium luteum]|jgi:NAD(P)-dependent dehydrogenase (short-subunit alcohol dehydrogenase family)|uniref:Short-chain dehydrogenase n=1 Tax=Chryseobacterium luteum TaxID=421531 RepID=A0A085YYI4_9FLAO|nr:SDR family oxidoreductase [Chryseobacterium luteum]KFE97247.1 short-chain dehydrogenase [Chryseobacterium luteum]
MSRNDLKDKVAIVGGGAKNLGRLISLDFAKKGAKVVVHFNSDGTKADADKTVSDIIAAGGEAFAIQGDLTVVENNTKLFDAAIEKYGKVDIAVNTTGMVIKKPIVNVTEEDYDKIFAVNSKAAFFFLQEAGKKLADNGKICTIVSSLLAAYTNDYAIYPGSKAPIEHYTRAASKEFGPRGISVTAVGPGPMETPFFYGQETEGSAAYNKSAAALSSFSKTGLTDPEDIVPLITFLVTDGWWITGQTIFSNGGYTTR